MNTKLKFEINDKLEKFKDELIKYQRSRKNPANQLLDIILGLIDSVTGDEDVFIQKISTLIDALYLILKQKNIIPDEYIQNIISKL